MTPAQLPPAWRERYEERAAIIEEGCHVSRMIAEAMAMAEIRRLMKLTEGV